MNRAAAALVTLSLCSLPASRTAAQETPDLFGLLDSRKVEEETILSRLGSNLGGTISLRGQQHLTDPQTGPGHAVRDENSFVESRLRLSTWTGNRRWRLSLDGWLEGGNGKDIWELQKHLGDLARDIDRRRRYLEANEFYLRLYRGSCDLMLGKAVFNNGIAPLYSPADRYGNADYNNPMDSRDYGVWIAQLDCYVGGLTLTGAVLPFYQPVKKPDLHSRWMSHLLDTADAPPGTSPENVNERIPGVRFENASFLLRAKSTVKGWDWFVSAYDGRNYRYVTKGVPAIVTVPSDTGMVQVETLALTKRIVRVANLAGGFTTTRNKWELHGEAVYNYSYGSKDDDYLSSVIGFRYTVDDLLGGTFLDKIEINADYARKLVTSEQSARFYIDSSKDARFSRDTNFGGNDLISRVTFTVNDDLDFDLVAVKQFSYDGLFLRLVADYELSESLELALYHDNFSGSHDSLFGCWDRNDLFAITFEYTF